MNHEIYPELTVNACLNTLYHIWGAINPYGFLLVVADECEEEYEVRTATRFLEENGWTVVFRPYKQIREDYWGEKA